MMDDQPGQPAEGTRTASYDAVAVSLFHHARTMGFEFAEQPE